MLPGRHLLVLAAALAAAAGSGFLTAQALSAGTPPTRTVTVDVATGDRRPAGPQGPPGPSGQLDCPTGFILSNVVFKGPHGQTTIVACVRD